MPDRTLLLTLPLDVAAERAALRDAGRADRFGARGQAFHMCVTEAFHALAAQEPARIRMIDAMGSEEAVSARILSEMADLLP